MWLTTSYKSVRAFHTGAKAMDRMVGRADFEGPVEKGGHYVLVDDVSTMGGALAELANHIRAYGGEVVGHATLVNASRFDHDGPSSAQLQALEDRYGNEIRRRLGIVPGALTPDEAAPLLRLRTPDGLGAADA